MAMKLLKLSAVLFCLALCACEKSPEPQKATPIPMPTGPIPGRHKITVTKLALSGNDFSLTAFGNPREIELYAAKDGERKQVGKISGFRGPKDLNLTFELDYDPNSRYEFMIEETVLMGQGKKWNLSGSQPGNWPFAKGGPFGTGSSIVFVDEKVR